MAVTQMQDSPYLFVHIPRPGKNSRRKDVRTAVQQHVMRDIAKQRRGRPRPKRNVKNTTISSWQTPNETTIRSTTLGGRIDPFIIVPVHIRLSAHFLIDYLCTCRKPRLQSIRDVWLPFSLSEPALFYEILSLVSRDIASEHPQSVDHGLAFDLHSRALRSIHERLSDPLQALSEGVIGTILAFACVSLMMADWKSYDDHMSGLVTIIKLKGGTHTISHNKKLRLILSGIDISASCFAGTPPRFPPSLRAGARCKAPSEQLSWWIPASSVGTQTLWQTVFPSDLVLSEICADICITLSTLNLELQNRDVWQDTSFVKDYVDALTYRLLTTTIEMADITKSNFMNECVRLAALVLLGKIRGRFPTRPVFTAVETTRLVEILKKYAEAWTQYRPMLLWVSVLGAIDVDKNEKSYLCQLVASTAESLGIYQWDDMMIHVSNLLWVGEVLDDECEALRRLVPLKEQPEKED